MQLNKKNYFYIGFFSSCIMFRNALRGVSFLNQKYENISQLLFNQALSQRHTRAMGVYV